MVHETRYVFQRILFKDVYVRSDKGSHIPFMGGLVSLYSFASGFCILSIWR